MRALIGGASGAPVDWAPVIDAVGATLSSNSLDPAFKGEAILLPSEALIADRMEVIDPDADPRSARRAARRRSARRWASNCVATHSPAQASGSDLSPAGQGHPPPAQRRARADCRGRSDEGATLAKAQFDSADNMTDRQGALGILVSLDAPEREAALAAFYDRFHAEPLVLDKWFALQAAAQRPDTVAAVERLVAHADFTLANPNRLRALAGTFGANQWAFNDASGRGYALLADMIIAADKLNPQVAARLVTPFGRWRRFEAKRGGDNARSARADRGQPVIVERRLRTGVEDPRLTWLDDLAADPAGDVGGDLVGGVVKRWRDRCGGPVGRRGRGEAARFQPGARHRSTAPRHIGPRPGRRTNHN